MSRSHQDQLPHGSSRRARYQYPNVYATYMTGADRADDPVDRSLRPQPAAMMRIEDVLHLDPALRQYASLPEMDPLTDHDALQEAQVLDVRLDALSGVVGILFDLRQALQLQEANTGVFVGRGVRELRWSGPSRDTALTAWSIGSSVPRTEDRVFALSLVMWPHPGAQLTLAVESAAFYVGDVPGLAEAPPDYTDRDRTNLDHAVACWDSSFEPVSAVFLDRAPVQARPAGHTPGGL